MSIGATRLRELGRPSAIVPDIEAGWLGKQARYHDGQLVAIAGAGSKTELLDSAHD
ncbi:hypothetical protein IGB42_03279 [Andreprevotia sp. IGB-42]|uniref:hypothetical protein n=1 Tax=Andreprevotia sp. IGB-42 TaxID=2497473 RepID=UPI00135BD4FB|nr:hypothetical protein [Andreprevotia sp. IGB-42]KAF0812289.1 hypothetical protein IGB42_03279 [Andreprevotia sp. IGB-42]